MEKVKQLIRRLGGERIQNLIIWFLKATGMNNKYILYSSKKACKDRVNIHYYSGVKNLGDAISPVVVEYAAKEKGVDLNHPTAGTKHLYAVGSVLTAGSQDCTVWGSGILNTKILARLRNRELDIRSVRGPLTRLILLEHGYAVPEVYGDPAILFPLIYNPETEKKYSVSVITHMNESVEDIPKGCHRIDIMTDDYKQFVHEVKASELIVSSSLHGIIFAEIYGVPAVLLEPQMDLFKYYDFYYSTGRYDFPVAQSVQEALELTPPAIPDYAAMQQVVLDAFPVDLWDECGKTD